MFPTFSYIYSKIQLIQIPRQTTIAYSCTAKLGFSKWYMINFIYMLRLHHI